MVELTTLGTVIDGIITTELSTDTSPVLGGDLDGGGNSISNFENAYKDEVGTTYTFLSGDTGNVLTFNNAGAITVTLPNDLPVGWVVACIQKGAGQVALSPASGATLNNIDTHTKISGQYGIVSLSVIQNSGGSSAIYILTGNTAT